MDHNSYDQANKVFNGEGWSNNLIDQDNLLFNKHFK
jgi:hypothetical protein